MSESSLAWYVYPVIDFKKKVLLLELKLSETFVVISDVSNYKVRRGDKSFCSHAGILTVSQIG